MQFLQPDHISQPDLSWKNFFFAFFVCEWHLFRSVHKVTLPKSNCSFYHVTRIFFWTKMHWYKSWEIYLRHIWQIIRQQVIYKSFNAGDQFGRYRKSLFSHDTGNQPINVTLHMRKPLVRSTSTANRWVLASSVRNWVWIKYMLLSVLCCSVFL